MKSYKNLLLLPLFLGSTATARQKPNILYVFADQFRNQAVAINGEDPTITPNIDNLARHGVVFNNAISSCPICTPFRGMLISGKYPLKTGVTRNCTPETHNLFLRPDSTAFGNAFKANGYQTGYIGKWHLDDPQNVKEQLGYSPDNGRGWDTYTPPGPKRQGFDFWHANNVYDGHLNPHYWENSPEMIVPRVWSPIHETDVAINFIENRVADKPFLLVVSYNPPHTPYGEVPEKYKALYPKDAKLLNRPNVKLQGPGANASKDVRDYFAGVTGVDDQFGRLISCLKKKGLFENTIVVFSADHGEMMGSQGRMTKGTWYEEAINIPFIVSYPAIMAHGKSNCLVSPIDILPSLLGLADLRVPQNYDGKDLSASFKNVEEINQEAVFLAGYPGDPYSSSNNSWEKQGWRGIRTLTHTFVINRKNEGEEVYLYDLKNDKWEMNPIVGTNPKSVDFKPYYELLKEKLVQMNDHFLN